MSISRLGLAGQRVNIWNNSKFALWGTLAWCANPNYAPDFWLLDGYVIEVPDKS